VSGEEVRQLLFPVTPETFVERYWQRQPLFIRGSAEKFRHLFDWDRFYRALAHHEERGIGIRVSFDSVHAPGQMSTHLPIAATDVPDYLERGASVCADPIDRGDAELADFAANVARQLNYVGGVSVKAYASPDGCGFNTHFDKGIATTLQIDGSKRWRYSAAPAVAFPLDNALLTPGGGVRYASRPTSGLAPWERVEEVDQSAFLEVTLEPGDVLCLPAGTWHNAKAIGRSLALNLSFHPLDAFRFFVLTLGGLLQERAEWRGGLPLAYSDRGTPGGSPPPVTAFFHERLRELQQVLQQQEVIQPRLHHGWQQLAVPTQSTPAQAPASVRIPAAARERDRSTGHSTTPRAQQAAGPSSDPTPAEAPSVDDYAGRMTCTVSVSRLDRSIRFYETVLGFRLLYRVDALSWCELASPVSNVTIGLAEVERVENRGGVVLTLYVKDLETARQRLEGLGVTFEGETRVIQNAVKLAAFFDPDGTRLVLSEALTQ
jgi:ribosomal protein L16 Arg81 hydroxylase/catechol 2,3-dioxygenase-like lactoylglutathione lyase family enzyme